MVTQSISQHWNGLETSMALKRSLCISAPFSMSTDNAESSSQCATWSHDLSIAWLSVRDGNSSILSDHNESPKPKSHVRLEHRLPFHVIFVLMFPPWAVGVNRDGFVPHTFSYVDYAPKPCGGRIGQHCCDDAKRIGCTRIRYATESFGRDATFV